MEVIRTYGNIIKKYAPDHPLAAFRMIKAGLALEQFRSKHLADKRMPGAYQYLNTYAVGEVLAALKHPETSVWANIFAPVELLQCFGLHSLSIECLSSFLSGLLGGDKENDKEIISELENWLDDYCKKDDRL